MQITIILNVLINFAIGSYANPTAMPPDRAKIIDISRHRFYTDGDGVTTLVAFHGCSLGCGYCLNLQSLGDSIPAYNTNADSEESRMALTSLGYSKFDFLHINVNTTFTWD